VRELGQRTTASALHEPARPRGELTKVPVCSLFLNGPGRIRTCDLALKVPSEQAATNCNELKVAASRTVPGGNEPQRTASGGDSHSYSQLLRLRTTEAASKPQPETPPGTRRRSSASRGRLAFAGKGLISSCYSLVRLELQLERRALLERAGALP